MDETEEPGQNPVTVMQVAAIMMLSELLYELQDFDKALGRRISERFKSLEDSQMARANPGSMELVRLVIQELEARDGK